MLTTGNRIGKSKCLPVIESVRTLAYCKLPTEVLIGNIGKCSLPISCPSEYTVQVFTVHVTLERPPGFQVNV
jgi:hypothetical protein